MTPARPGLYAGFVSVAMSVFLFTRERQTFNGQDFTPASGALLFVAATFRTRGNPALRWDRRGRRPPELPQRIKSPSSSTNAPAVISATHSSYLLLDRN